MMTLRNILTLSAYALLLGCGVTDTVEQGTNSDTLSAQDTVYNYPGDTYSDSLQFNQNLRADIYITCLKKNKTSVIVKTLEGEEISKTDLTTEHENEILLSDLTRGIYMLEAYDKTGLVMCNRFVIK